MEPSLSAGSSQRGASVKWTAKLIWPDGGGSAARPGVAAHGTKDRSNAARSVRPRDFLTMPLSIDLNVFSPRLPARSERLGSNGALSTFGGRGMRDSLSLCEGRGRGEGAEERSCLGSGRHIEMAAREMWLEPLCCWSQSACRKPSEMRSSGKTC